MRNVELSSVTAPIKGRLRRANNDQRTSGTDKLAVPCKEGVPIHLSDRRSMSQIGMG